MSNSEHQERKVKIFGVEFPANPISIDEGKRVSGVKLIREGKDYIDVACGCTSRSHDQHGILRIWAKCSPQVTCLCQPYCHSGLSPNMFLKHAGITAGWKNRIWVYVNGCKEAVGKTKLLEYYSGSASNQSPNVGRRDPVHRDEFIACSSCKKERRFKLSNPTQCRVYHELDRLRESWECIDYPYAQLSCESPEESKEGKKKRGCKRHLKCNGCKACVCPGCVDCRFKRCPCRTCVDFYLSYKPQGASGSSSSSGKRKWEEEA